MCGMLLQEFFDGTPLQTIMVAYVPGVKFQDDKFESEENGRAPCNWRNVSWNTYKRKTIHPPMINGIWGQQINPITWDKATTTSFDQHLGVLNADSYPNALRLQR